MPTIIISSELAEPEKEIISGTAKSLDYKILGPDLLNHIASDHNIPVEQLREALEATPAVWRWKRSKRWSYHLACIESEVSGASQSRQYRLLGFGGAPLCGRGFPCA